MNRSLRCLPLRVHCRPTAAQYTNALSLPWTKDILLGNDQLRQRVALALSEIFTVSFDEVTPTGLPTYQNILATNAFGNYQTLMKQVTLNTAMGEFLNMATIASR